MRRSLIHYRSLHQVHGDQRVCSVIPLPIQNHHSLTLGVPRNLRHLIQIPLMSFPYNLACPLLLVGTAIDLPCLVTTSGHHLIQIKNPC